MPRDGSDQYSIPPGTNGVPDTTIESAKYNAFAADLEVDLNHPRPIVAGGTGANNAHDAMIALSGEIAGQFVTNYDTFPFVAGSFYSNSAATSLPVAGYEFIGICYVYDANSMVLDGRIRTAPGTRYFRQKINGTWGAWAQQAGSVADLDAAYVNVAGDTMTGALAISATTASTSPTTGALTVAGGVGVSGAINSGPITMKYGTLRIANGANSGALVFGDGSSNEGLLSFDGTNFSLTGGTNLILNAQLLVTQPYICSGQGGTTGTYYFGNSGTKYLSYDGTNYTLAGGALFAQSEIWSGTSGVGGTYRFGNAGSKYLNYDGTNFNLVGGNLNVSYLVASGQIFVGSPGTTGTLQFGSSATKYLQYDGTNFNLAGGNLNIAGATVTSGQLTLQGYGGNANAGLLAFGNAGNHYLYFDGVNYTLPNGGFYCGSINANGSVSASAGNLNSVNGSGGYLYLGPSNTSMFAWQGTQAQLQWMPAYYFVITQAGGLLNYVANNAVAFTSNFNGDFTVAGNASKPGGGAWSASSDARIKNELGNYTRGLTEIAALRPIYYTYKGNDTPEAPAHIKQEDIDSKAPLAVPYPNSMHIHAANAATKYAGLIAQEVEAIFPEMVTKRSAYIDGQPVDDLRDLDTTPLIFALINAVKELKAEIDALKAAR